MDSSLELKDVMQLPAPKLRDPKLWMLGESSTSSKDSMQIWEIGVPARNSLYWSIIMSYLLSDNNPSNRILKNLIGDEHEMNKIKKKKNMNPGKIYLGEVKRELMNFNPFKNRHTAFFWPNLNEVFRIFKLRLNRYSDQLKPKGGEWNDELKLQAAAEMLDCQIVVYLPDERDRRRSYGNRSISDDASPRMTLFQYTDQQYGKKIEKCNIFRFGMELHRAHPLKLNTLQHVLDIAKISKENIQKIKKLMDPPETHGKGFLPTLLQSECIEVLPNLYKSPYIVLKLSEAGFETDPTAARDENLSPLCYALGNANRRYIQILYDYASNFRCLFDRCLRDDANTILESVKRLKVVLENDTLKMDRCQFREDFKRRVVDTLKQFSRFAEYQCEAVSSTMHLKTQLSSQANFNEFQFRKGIIESILYCYLKYFYYGALNSDDFFEKFTNYLDYTEFYENIDIFASISFFDNFYSLKCCFGLTKENNFLNTEWLLFLAMMSSKYFPKHDHFVSCKDDHDKRQCEQEKSILRIIPLVHRMSIESSFKCLLTELQNTDNPKTVPRSIANDACAFPQIIDALLIFRLQMYMKVVLEESIETKHIRLVLAIERTLQVIGESLKPPSTKSSVASFLLCARLPRNLKKAFINIRNGLKCQSNSVYGRLNVEKQVGVWNDIKNELRVIQKAFDVVDFTQDLRIEESILNNCMTALKNYALEPGIIHLFQTHCEFRINSKRDEYRAHHCECMQLLRDIVTDLHGNITQNKPDTKFDERLGQLKAIEYLLYFICKYLNDNNFENVLEKVKNISQRTDAGSTAMKSELKQLLFGITEYVNKVIFPLKRFETDLSTSTPEIQKFLSGLKTNMFSLNEQTEIKNAVDRAYNEAGKATDKLKDKFAKNEYNSTNDEIECLLKKILFLEEKTETLRSYYLSRNGKKALKCLKKSNLSTSIKNSIQEMLDSGSNVGGYASLLLMKIAFPSYTGKNFYDSVTLSPEVNRKLRDCLTKKAHFLLDRLRALKCILIDDDKEIESAWKFGKSEAIKRHMKFLMRQRYMREGVVRASLEMALCDCLNILNSKELQNLYEKSTHLFRGINIRNVISHRFCAPEIVGVFLDEDDFPSEMINKILELIEDSNTIQYLLQLFEKSGIFERKAFESYIKKCLNDNSLDKQISETIQKCQNWEGYLSVFPLL